MKAAIYNGQGDIALTVIETPVCGDHDVLIRNLFASVCGSDVSAFLHGPRSHRISPGSEFGHEVVSEVAAVGRSVKGVEVGQRVYPYPLLARGDTSRAGTLGGFSEYILVPNCELNRQVYAVSDKISSKTASLIEPFTVAHRTAGRAQPQLGETAVVFGAGTIGIGTAISLRDLGCSNVLVVDLSDFRLQKAAGLGFETCNSSRESLQDKAVQLFGEAPTLRGVTANVDIFIEAAGADSLIDTFQSLGKIGSRMVVVGVHSTPRPIDMAALCYSQHSIIGSGGYFPEDVKSVMEIMERGEFNIESIVTHEFPQDEIVKAIETAGDVNQALNVVIKY